MNRIVPADLDDPQVRALLSRHAERARAETGRGSAHALDVDGLKAPDIAVFALYDDEGLAGAGALKRLSGPHAELKAMYVSETRRRSGAGSAMVEHLVGQARARGLTRVSLETGAWPYFAPARALYAKHGFTECGPIEGYVEDENSVFMTREL
ncbi:MAG TPA: GNAT family N-acetyltransferase [Caulobacteraceae bacterium]|jgi:putative acetyltransferase|nr:GNAT family N-acetyltransferase [Caulobacteraceae bacterium]